MKETLKRHFDWAALLVAIAGSVHATVVRPDSHTGWIVALLAAGLIDRELILGRFRK